MTSLSTLQANFKGDLVTPDHADYTPSIARWAANAARKASLVAFVKDTDDVSAVISYARASKLEIAIRGGGHNPSGASSTIGGVVIDLSRYMNGVRVDAEKKLAYVGGGSLWRTVDEEAIKHGLATVGGTVNHTGVAGLTLGGGYGWLSGSYGLVIDNLRQATIVTADGSVLTVNESENSDLFWGIKGGGSNFGVVTEFVYQLHPQRETVYSGVIVFSPDKLREVVDACNKWWNNEPSEKEALLVGLTRGPDGSPVVILSPFYNGSEEEGRKVYKFLFDLGPLADMTREMPYEELNGQHNAMAVHGKGNYMKGYHFTHLDYPSTQKALDTVLKYSGEGAKFVTAAFFEFFPLRKILSVSDEENAMRRKNSGGCNGVALVYWNPADPNDANGLKEVEKEAQMVARAIAQDAIDGQVSSIPKEQNTGYGNYDVQAASEQLNYEKTRQFFGSNYERLQKLKRQYDPEVVFRKWFAIEPAAA